jgi:hypothetical protein
MPRLLGNEADDWFRNKLLSLNFHFLLAQYGVSEKLCNIIRALYTETKAAVRVEGELTDRFDIVNGLRQECLLSPILFNVNINHVLKIALKGYKGTVRIEFRMSDGRRARGALCEGVERVMELLYADDLVIICECCLEY